MFSIKNVERKHTISLQDCDVKRNNNKSYQLACIGSQESTRTQKALTMRSQEIQLVNINLFFFLLHKIPIICLNIAFVLSRARLFFQLRLRRVKKRLLSDYISWENHFDHVDSATVVVLLRYPPVYECTKLNDYAIWVRVNRGERKKERGRTFDMIKPATNLSEAKRSVFISFLSNSLLLCLQIS